MGLRSGSLGTLLQGVSQQPDRVRLDGQVTQQINMLSDVTRGLGTRPATTDGPALTGASSDMNFEDIQLNGKTYLLGHREGFIQLWDLEGTAYPVTPDPDMLYIGGNMAFQVLDNEIVCVNRDKIVRAHDIVPGTPFYAAIFYALGGQFSKKYTVKVQFEGFPEFEVSYTTPDGTNAGDAALTSSDKIIRELVDLLVPKMSDPTLCPANAVVNIRTGSIAKVSSVTTPVSMTVEDGEGGTVLRSITSVAQDLTDLPKTAPNGMRVRIVGSDASEDDYYLVFDAEGVTAVDSISGFGKEGTWIETYGPDDPRDFRLSTMPHILRIEDDVFTLSRGDWISRPTGDAVTAPFPSIVDKRIRDVSGFESRLVLLSEDSVVMSRTNEQYDLWRNSATVVVATDPVDITSTKKDSLRLDWLVPFDRDLFVIADPGDSQFVIAAGIEPETASMVLTTEFDVYSAGASPRSTGRTILLPFKKGVFSGVKEFYTDADTAANAANSLTETVDRYINGSITKMAVSQNFNLALFLTDLGKNTVWVYKYLWDGNDPLQSCWSTWEFTDSVIHVFFDGSELNFLSADLDDEVFLHTLDLNRPDDEFNFHIMLDRKRKVTVAGGSVDLPYKDARFVQAVGCSNPGLELTPISTQRVDGGTVRYTFGEDAPDGAQLYSGQSIRWELEPTRVFGKDYQQRIDTSQRITVQEYLVSLFESGSFTTTLKTPYGDEWSWDYELFPFDNEPTSSNLLLHTGAASIPWGERADLARAVFSGTDTRPMTIHEVEWTGQILQSKGRRV